MELAPCCHSQSGGSRGTEGRERAGTAAAEERFLAWTGGEGGVLSITGVEEVVTAGTLDESGTRPEVGLLLYSGCWGFGIGERDGSGRQRARGRDVGLGRGGEAAQRQRLGQDLGGCGGRKLLELVETTGAG